MSNIAVHTKERLTNEEERQLAELARGGNSRALEKLLTANMGFVINLAKEYQGQGVELDDLVSEGNIALMLAVNKWDPDKTERLTQYAVWDIRKVMQRIVDRQGNVVRVPVGEETKVKSMDAPLRQGHTRSLGESMPQKDHAPANDVADDNSFREALIDGMDILNDRERAILTDYYGIGTPHLSMAEIGEKMGLKRERVRQIRKKAEIKLKKIKL